MKVELKYQIIGKFLLIREIKGTFRDAYLYLIYEAIESLGLDRSSFYILIKDEGLYKSEYSGKWHELTYNFYSLSTSDPLEAIQMIEKKYGL